MTTDFNGSRRRLRRWRSPARWGDNPILWWAVSGGYAIVIAVLAVLPPAPGVSVGRLDKLAHLCEYALFAWGLRHAARASSFSRSSELLLALGFSIIYGALLEGAQGLLGYRSAEWGDVAANTLGAVLGAWLSKPKP